MLLCLLLVRVSTPLFVVNCGDIYTMSQKKEATKLLAITFSSLNRFLQRDASAERGDATVSCPSVRL